jgi:sarcosine oxidase
VGLFEQFHVGHDRGSSHGTARIFKLCYPEARFTRLAQRSLGLWRDLERETGHEILSPVGSVDVATPDDLAKRCRSLEQCGVPFERVTLGVVGERYGIGIASGAPALLQRDGGVLHADQAQQALLETANACRLTLFENTPVAKIRLERGGVRIATPGGDDFCGRCLLITAGAWVCSLIEPLGVQLPLQATRETVGYFTIKTSRDDFPALSDWRQPPRGEVFYGLRTRDALLKVGLSGSGPRTDPSLEGTPDLEVIGYAAGWAAENFPLASARPASSETCLYTNAPRQAFLFRRIGRIVIGSPCSGHGFKFAPVIGERLARLALQATA